MISAAWAFLTTKIGRYLAIAGAVLAFVGGIALTFYSKGRRAEKGKRLESRLKAIKQKEQDEDEIQDLDDIELARRISRMRDDG